MRYQKTSKDDFENYRAEVRRLVQLLGLVSYDLCFEVRDLPGRYAQLEVEEEGKIAKFVFASRIPLKSYAGFSPEETARHEVAHLLLSKLVYIADSRCVSPEQVSLEWEALAVTLTRVLTLAYGGSTL